MFLESTEPATTTTWTRHQLAQNIPLQPWWSEKSSSLPICSGGLCPSILSPDSPYSPSKYCERKISQGLLRWLRGVKNPIAMQNTQETRVWSLGGGRSHREGNGNWFQYPCLKIPWMEESGRPQPIGSQRVRHDWVTSLTLSEISQGSPGGSVVENLPDNTGATGVVSSIPGSRRSPGGGNGNPLQYSHLENPMDRGAWWATAHGVTKESDMTQQLNRNNKR